MRIKETNPNNIFDIEQRAYAKLARIARCDVHFGGAKAMVLARRMEAINPLNDAMSVVSQAYASSTGNAEDYLSYECPECGSPCAGIENALQCCQLIYE